MRELPEEWERRLVQADEAFSDAEYELPSLSRLSGKSILEHLERLVHDRAASG